MTRSTSTRAEVREADFASLAIQLLGKRPYRKLNLHYCWAEMITVERPAKTPTGTKTTTTVAIVPETKFIKNGSPAALKDLKIGDRVVIHALKKGDQFEAHTVRIGASQGTDHPR